jgi:hypothetical protein
MAGAIASTETCLNTDRVTSRFTRCFTSWIARHAVVLAGLALASTAVDAQALTVVPTFLEASTGFGAVHVISGDGRRVVYESSSDPVGSNADGNGELFLWDETLGVSQLTDTVGSNYYWEVEIDQTGETIARVADADVTGAGATKTELYRWVDGGGWTRLTTTTAAFDEVFSGGIGISSDGGTLLFTSRGDYTGANAGMEEQVFLWRAAGGFEQITTAAPCGGGGGNFASDLSGDGTRILLSSRCRINGGNPDLKGDVYLWDASSGFTALTNEADEVGGVGTLDADGSTAALVSSHDLVNGGYGSGEHLFRWREVGGFEQLSSESVAHRAPSIDADGSRIAYAAANGQGTAGNPEGTNEIFLWDTGAIFELTDSTQTDDYYGNERPDLDDSGTRLVMLAARAFDAPTDLRTGYYLLDVPEPTTAAQGAVAVAALLASAAARRRGVAAA